MEVVGIVLGGIPLVLWALDNYRRALNPTKDYWRYESTLNSISMNIFIQKEQLVVTFNNMGLQGDSLAEVKFNLRRRYPDKCDAFMNILGHMDQIVHKLMDKLCIDVEGKPKWKEVALDRVEWEWRRVKRSFGKKERQSLIDELQYWNNALKNCFEKQEIPSDEGDRSIQELKARFDHKQCNAIRENACAIYKALHSGWGCTCPEPHGGNLHLEWHNEKMVAPTVFRLGLSYRKAQHGQPRASDECWQNIRIQIEDAATQLSAVPATQLPPLASASLTPPIAAVNAVPSPSLSKQMRFRQLFGFEHTSTSFDSRSVKSNHFASSSRTSFTSVTTSLPQRLPSPSPISGLCKLLKSCTTTGNYLGYIPHPISSPTRHIQIHNTAMKSSLPNMMSISSLLSPSNQHVLSKLALSRKKRFGIAASIVWAVLFLCDSPWLSEKLDQDEIQVLLDDGDSDTLSEPAGNTCVSHRFYPQVAELVPSAQPSTTDQFQDSQIRNKTLFALSILLIELCLNCPFAELRRTSQSQSQTHSQNPSEAGMQSTVATVTATEDYAVAETLTEKVYLEAGHQYGYAVQRCLRCEFPGRDVTKNFRFQSFRTSFFSGVVAPIQATFDLIPDSCAAFLS